MSFAKGFSKHPHILAIFKVDSEYLRFPFKVKADYFILYSVLVYSFVIFLIFFAMNKRRRTNEASLLNYSKLGPVQTSCLCRAELNCNLVRL